MNRTLLAVSAGLIMGAVLFGMVQRDQSVDASPSIEHPASTASGTGPRTLRDVAPSHIRHPGPQSQRPRWSAQGSSTPRTPVDYNQPSPFDEIPSATVQPSSTTVADEWQQRRADRQRELAERRRQLLETQGGRQQLDTTVVNTAAQEAARNLGVNFDNRRQSLEGRIANQRSLETADVAEARKAFQDQLADGVGGENGTRDATAQAAADAPETIAGELEALLGDRSPLPGASAADAFGGFDFTRLIDGKGFLNGKLITSGGGFPPIPGLPPVFPPGFPGNPGGPTDDEPLLLRAEWFPVAAVACETPEYSRANDLYIRVNKAYRVINVTSSTATGLRVVGGEFRQGAFNGNVTPTDLTSCAAMDTFLAYGPVVPTVAGSSPFANTADGQVVSSSWFGFTNPTTPGVVPPVTKPGDKRRLWVGRFVVSGNPQSVSGKLTVALVNPESLIPIPTFVTIDIPHDPLLWSVDGDAPPPALTLFDIAQANVVAGKPILVNVGIEDPAPVGGVTVYLSSSSPDVISLPSAITIAEGQSSRTLSVRTFDVSTRTDVVLSAAARGVALSDAIAVDPRTPGDFDSDGSVDGVDLAGILAAWGSDHPFADFNGDGIVDGQDLAQVLASWSASLPPTQPGDDGPVVARWIPVALSGACSTALDQVRTADLYLGFEDALRAPAATIVQSAPSSGLRIEGGVFYQDPQINQNSAPSPGFISLFPCVVYDSYITLGETAPTFTPGNVPSVNWGTELVAEWLTSDFSGQSIQFEVNQNKFGDSRRYIRIARISATEGATYVGGRLLVRYAPVGTNTIESTVVTVDHNPAVWGQLDLNADGLLDALDVDLMIAAMGSDSLDADLDASGAVDADDLRILLLAISDPESMP